MKRSEIFFSALLVPVDFLALILGFSAAYQIRDQVSLGALDDLSGLAQRVQFHPVAHLLPVGTYWHYLAYIIPAMLLVFGVVGLYRIRSTSSWGVRFLNILIGVSGGEFGILLLFLLKKDFFLPRSTVIYSWVFCTIFVLLGRTLVRLAQLAMYRRKVGIVRIGLVGEGELSNQIAQYLQPANSTGYKVVKQFEGVDVAEILPQIDREKIDELIIVSPRYRTDDLVILRNHCLEHSISFSFVPPLLAALESSFEVRSLFRLPMIEVRPTPLEGWGRVLKRSFDIIFSTLLIVLFSPLFLLISIWLKLASPGPLIYKHKRIGKNKKPIYIWKFRSFYWEYCTGSAEGDAKFAQLLAENPKMAEEWKQDQKLKDDPRVSPPGKFLRKTRLDELPQFFNVLMGGLSLVGPRPIVDAEVGKFGEKARILFTVKPGVTGLWQVSGGNDLAYDDRVAMNTYYIEHWNVWMDLVIMAKTGLLLIGKAKKGAY